MHWLALEISEFAGVPMRMIRDQMQEKVIGYKEYAERIGRMATERMKK